MTFDHAGYETQVDRRRRSPWGGAGVDAINEESPNTMLPVRRTDMEGILRDVAQDRN